jgi:putative transposase
MQKSRFTEEQSVATWKDGEAGVPLPAVLRRHGISGATYCTWRSKYAGTSVAERRRTKGRRARHRGDRRLPPGGSAGSGDLEGIRTISG